MGQSAIQFWCLLRNIQLIFGDLVQREDKYWQHLMLYLQIVDIVFIILLPSIRNIGPIPHILFIYFILPLFLSGKNQMTPLFEQGLAKMAAVKYSENIRQT